LSKKKALIVDDEKSIRKIVTAILKQMDYEVFEAEDGTEGVEKAKEVVPDLILMDIMMPKIDGIEATLRIKNSPGTKDIPVIMLTSLIDSKAVLKSYDYGADHYLNKPFNKEQLEKAVRVIEKIRKRKI